MPSPPDTCPVCGADVPSRARSCPECGADENTGWSEKARYDELGIPDEGAAVVAIIVGVPGETPASSPRKPPQILSWLA